MADFYPLIARAVAELSDNTIQDRHALFERARTTLLTQLRGMTPYSVARHDTAALWG
jgi:hypothetical protein